MSGAATLDALRAPLVLPLVAALSSAGPARLVVPGPELLVIAGVAIPIFSAGAGMLGVALGLLLAPPPIAAPGVRRRSALVIALLAMIVALVIATGQQVLVALGWGIGLGFSGLAVIETIGAQAMAAIRTVTGAFVGTLLAKFNGKGSNGGG